LPGRFLQGLRLTPLKPWYRELAKQATLEMFKVLLNLSHDGSRFVCMH
jgi:hypothetical protein